MQWIDSSNTQWIASRYGIWKLRIPNIGDVMIDWDSSKELGTYRITRTWKTPHSYVSSTMNQVYATVNGITYTGRSAGVGMLFRGRKVSHD
jgi:hypothetical protein